MLPTPIIIVNFKTYPSATGQKALELAKLHEEVANELGVNLAIAVSALDLARVASQVRIPVLAQHIDAATAGSSTGRIVPEQVKACGAVGTLLNHSEYRITTDLATIHAAARRAGLATVICVESSSEAKLYATLQPNFLAIEPPELIGGDISVTTARPEIIPAAVADSSGIPLLVGAGVKNGIDVAAALRLGAVGVLLASGVTKSADPRATLRDLSNGLHK